MSYEILGPGPPTRSNPQCGEAHDERDSRIGSPLAAEDPADGPDPSPGGDTLRIRYMLLSYITERSALGGNFLSFVGQALQAGVDFVQVREKDLSAHALYEICIEILQLPNPHGTRILVNARADVALAAGAHGVHLPAGSPSPARLRTIAPESFVIGVSCHSLEEVRRAGAEGADYAVFGPVFETPSKQAYGPAQGLERLREACEAVDLPVLALGGVKLDSALPCLRAGAAGIAAISLFQQSNDVETTVRQLRRLEEEPR